MPTAVVASRMGVDDTHHWPHVTLSDSNEGRLRIFFRMPE